MTPSVYAAIRYHARLNPQAVAVTGEGISWNYREFTQHIDRVTARLVDAEIALGVRCCVRVNDLYLNWLLVIALARLGATSAMVAGAADMALLKPALVITDAPREWPAYRTLEAGVSWYDSPRDAAKGVDAELDEGGIAQIFLSSGTTGRAKLVPVTFGRMVQRLRVLGAEFNWGPSTRMLCTMGISTALGTLLPFSVWSTGGTVIYPIIAAGRGVLRILRHRPNVLFMSTAQLEALVGALPADFLPVPDLRVFVTGSVLPRAVNVRTRLRLTPALYIAYGSTEAHLVALAPASHTETRPQLTGYVLPSSIVQVVDEAGTPLPSGTMGEIRLRSELLFDGYLDDDAATAACLRDGWLYPGDVGALGENGDLSITGRAGETLNFGGVKLSPERVEESLAGIAGVVELAAFATKDANGIDQPALAVVAGEGFDGEALTQAFRKAWPMVKSVAIREVAKLPRNEMGKVVRSQLAGAAATKKT